MASYHGTRSSTPLPVDEPHPLPLDQNVARLEVGRGTPPSPPRGPLSLPSPVNHRHIRSSHSTARRATPDPSSRTCSAAAEAASTAARHHSVRATVFRVLSVSRSQASRDWSIASSARPPGQQPIGHCAVQQWFHERLPIIRDLQHRRDHRHSAAHPEQQLTANQGLVEALLENGRDPSPPVVDDLEPRVSRRGSASPPRRPDRAQSECGGRPSAPGPPAPSTRARKRRGMLWRSDWAPAGTPSRASRRPSPPPSPRKWR